MALAPEYEAVIRSTLPLVGANIDEIARRFYESLFRAAPSLHRDVFNRGNQDQGAQQRALAASVGVFANMLVTPGAPESWAMLRRIAHKHVAVGVTAEQYELVHDHLFAAIVEVLGADVVTPEVAEAWDEVYWIMAATLTGMEHQLYRKAGRKAGETYRKAVIAAKRELSPGTVQLELAPREGDDPLPGFVPGQYATLRVLMPDKARQPRQYSIVSAPHEPHWTVVVKKVVRNLLPPGEVSRVLVDEIQVGDEVEVGIPSGTMQLDPDSHRALVLISHGIGAAPMLSMLRHLAHVESSRWVVVVHTDTSGRDAPLVPALREACAALPSAELHLFQPNDTMPGVERGRPDLLGMDLPWTADYYMCGSNYFLRNTRGDLLARGTFPSTIHQEFLLPNDWMFDADVN